MNEERPGPPREFWVAIGWSILILCGIVLLVAAGWEMWGW